MLIIYEGRPEKVLLRESIVAVFLIFVLVFSMSSTGAFVAQAGKTGPTIGKFLEIDFTGSDDGVSASDCNVTATKDSGQVFTFEVFENLTYSERVGAGTVLLEAIPDDGWKFGGWTTDNVDESTPFGNNFAYYKTEKLGVVGAVFVRDAYTITAQVFEESQGNGHIETTVNGEPLRIDTSETLDVQAGETPTFNFVIDSANYHISVIQVENLNQAENNINFYPSASSYTFNPVSNNFVLTVYFSPDGQAIIPNGASGVDISLGNAVSLNFGSVDGGGTAIQENIIGDLDPRVQPSSLILWNVGLIVGFSFDTVTITLQYTIDSTHPAITHIFTSNSVDALYSDVNGDGKVNGDDVSDVANMIKTLVGQQIYDPLYDIDRNTILDQHDVHMVNHNKGAIIEELEFDPIYDTNDILIGYLIYTGHLSIFRGR